MSLDVWLTGDNPFPRRGSRIFIREDGCTNEISREEWDRRFPGIEPVTAEVNDDQQVYSGNITHNLNKMAMAAGIYEPLWRPDEVGITLARQLIDPLTAGLERLRASPDAFKAHNPLNGWGTYEGLVLFVEEYLDACRAHPTATIGFWR
jgi:hypothetical protein